MSCRSPDAANVVAQPRKTRPSTGLGTPRHSFVKLARAQRFAEIIDILDHGERYNLEAWLFLEVPKRRWARDRSSQNLHLFRGETPLHVLLHYHPTLDVVEKLIEALSTDGIVPEDAVDMLGRTPLHVGAVRGCSVAVMSRLLDGVSVVMPAVAKDSRGRHALHWACVNPTGESDMAVCRTFQRPLKKNLDPKHDAIENMVQVIYQLIKAYPEASMIPDDDGNLPFDLANKHRADKRISELVEQSYKNCVQAQKLRAAGKHRHGRSKDQGKNTKEVSITEASSEEDVPAEVSDHNFDDVSSIGSAGVSLFGRKRGKGAVPWSLHVTRIEEAIEL